MNIYGYGEDALTLWALKNKLSEIIPEDEINEECKIFYRPSFGRGGKGKTNFGEMDFIIITSQKIYLGESKWDKLGKIKRNNLELARNQILRHKILSEYIRLWYPEKCWSSFDKHKEIFKNKFKKDVPGKKTDLAVNLMTLLAEIGSLKTIFNVLLYFHNGSGGLDNNIKKYDDVDFLIKNINYSHEKEIPKNLIQL